MTLLISVLLGLALNMAVPADSGNDAPSWTPQPEQTASSSAPTASEPPRTAEWEYACRAGTLTPFNTEHSLSADDANFYGHYPYEIEENYFNSSVLEQAAEIGYIRVNPADACKLPRAEKAEIKPLDSEDIARFVQVISGHPFENVYLVTLFTGMREGEVLGLTWDCIDFENGTITIRRQLMRERGKGTYTLATPKNGKSRCIKAAATVMQILKQERTKQAEARLRAGMLWDNPLDLVFTNELGRNLSAQTVYLHFKKLAEKAGVPAARFHDLRHSYAVAALQSGDDIKTVQENLGHFSASFTLDVYGHVTEQMKKASAERMEQFIKGVSGA